MEIFKYRVLLLATSGMLALTSFAHAADDDFEKQLAYALKLSEQTAREREAIQNTQLTEVVRYMLARPGKIRETLNGLVYRINNIIDPYALGWNQIAQLPHPENLLGLDETKKTAWEDFVKECVKHSVNPVVMEPLFAYLWDCHIQKNPFLQEFTTTYGNIVTKMKANEGRINTILKPIFQSGNPSDIEIAQLSTLMAQLGIQKSYETLETQRDDVTGNLFQPLEDIRKNPERFIEQAQQKGVTLDLSTLLVEGEGIPEISEGKKDEAIVIKQKPVRPPLSSELTNFQKKITGLIEEAGRIKFSKETVRELGRTHVSPNYQILHEHINGLFASLSAPETQPVDTWKSLTALYEPVKDALGKEVTNEIDQIYITMHKLREDDQTTRQRLNGTSSYEYLGQVFSQVARTYTLLQQHNPGKANEYLINVFYTFHTQMEETGGGMKYVACQLGMTVRLFQIHALTLDTLVAHYTS